MKIRFHPAANADLDHIFSWIAKDNPIAAHEMIERIERRIAPLVISSLKQMGRPGLVKGTRELIEAPYIIVYQIRDESEEIVILAVVHSAQDR